ATLAFTLRVLRDPSSAESSGRRPGPGALPRDAARRRRPGRDAVAVLLLLAAMQGCSRPALLPLLGSRPGQNSVRARDPRLCGNPSHPLGGRPHSLGLPMRACISGHRCREWMMLDRVVIVLLLGLLWVSVYVNYSMGRDLRRVCELSG